MAHQENLFSPTANFLLFYDVVVYVDLNLEGELLEL